MVFLFKVDKKTQNIYTILGLRFRFVIGGLSVNQTLKKFLKYALNILLILGITALTLHLLFKDNEPKKIFAQIKDADGRWLGIAALLMIVFVCGESVQFRMLFKGMKQKVHSALQYRLLFQSDHSRSIGRTAPPDHLYDKAGS